MTLGGHLLFHSRRVHALIHLAGVPRVRPLAQAVGSAGCSFVLAALIP